MPVYIKMYVVDKTAMNALCAHGGVNMGHEHPETRPETLGRIGCHLRGRVCVWVWGEGGREGGREGGWPTGPTCSPVCARWPAPHGTESWHKRDTAWTLLTTGLPLWQREAVLR